MLKVFDKSVTVIETKRGIIESYKPAELVQNFVNLAISGIEHTRPALDLANLADIVEAVIDPTEDSHAMWLAQEILSEAIKLHK